MGAHQRPPAQRQQIIAYTSHHNIIFAAFFCFSVSALVGIGHVRTAVF